MLSRDQINGYLAIIIETLYEAGDAGFPSGHLYAAMMGHVSLDEYQGLLAVAKQIEIVKESSHLLTLTDKGRAMLAKLIIHRAAQKVEARRD